MKQITRAVIYARYSSNRQNETSIEDQLTACHQYAEEHQYTIVDQYCDFAMSGRSDDRPQFQRMIEDAKEHKFAVILIWKIDRFSRNMQDHYYYEHILTECDVRLESCKENIIGTSIEATINKGFISMYAQIRSQQISEDTMRRMVAKAEKCQYLGYQWFGYTHDGDEIIIDKEKAPVAARIHTDYLAGKPIQTISDELNAQGYRTSKGKLISYNFIIGILHNMAYAGIYQWGKQRDEFGKVMKDDNGQVIPLVYKSNGIPAIVDMDTKIAVLDRLGHRRQLNFDHPYPLSGKIICGKCRKKMHGIKAYNRLSEPYHYYACKGKNTCCFGPVNQAVIEGAIAEGIREMLNDRNLCSHLADGFMKYQGADRSSRPSTNAAKQELAAVRKQKENLFDAIQDGLKYETVRQRMEDLEAQELSIMQRLEMMEAEAPMHTHEDVMNFLQAISEGELSDADLLEGCVSDVWVYGDTAAVIMNFRAGTCVSQCEIEHHLEEILPDQDGVRQFLKWCPKDTDKRTSDTVPRRRGKRKQYSTKSGVPIVILDHGFGLFIKYKVA